MVQTGGTLIDDTVLGATVYMDGTASGIVVKHGAFYDTSNSTTSCVVQNGGVEYVTGGTASHTRVLSGGNIATTGGTATDVAIFSGGVGSATSLMKNATVKAGGQLFVQGSGRLLSSVTVQSGGLLAVLPDPKSSPPTAIHTELKQGATLVIAPGGTLTGLTIDPGVQVVSASVLMKGAREPPSTRHITGYSGRESAK